jgi:hypothetical protein
MPASDPIAPPRVVPFAESAPRRPRPPAGPDRAVPDRPVPLDDLAQARAAALPGPFRYRLKGVTFTLPPVGGLPLEVAERVRGTSDPLAVVRAVVGEEKTREMAAAGFTLCDLDVIVEEWERRCGVRF